MDIYDPYPPIQNKYYTWYIDLCHSRQLLGRVKTRNDGLTKHHIVPDSFYINSRRKVKYKKGWLEGNSNERYNLVLLTDKEHFIAHWLLTKCYMGLAKWKMINALVVRMCNKSKSSLHYEIARKLHLENIKGEGHWNYGNKEPPEVSKKRSVALKGRPIAENVRLARFGRKQSLSHVEKRMVNQTGSKRTPEQCDNISESLAKKCILAHITNNEEILVINIKKFCDENNLNFGNMCSVIRGERKIHKGWICIRSYF